MGLLTNLVALVKKTGSPLGKVFAQARHSTRQLAARPRFRRSSPTSPPPVSHGADLSFGEEETRFANHAPASPRYSTSFPQVLACLFYRCACFLRALCVRACIALPCRSRLTVIQLANVHHVSRVDDFVLVVRCGSSCTSCGSRLTFSQIWRMSPSRWRVDSFYSHLYFHV